MEFLEQFYFVEASLNAIVTNGTYTFVVNSPLGTTTTQFSYTKTPLTAVPRPTGLADGATGVSTNPTFNWNPISDSNPNDNLELELDGPNSSDNTIFDQQFDTSTTSSGPIALDASSNYSVELRLNSWTNSTNTDGFNFNAGITNETDLLFTTAASNAAPGLSITSVDFPDGTIHPGDWIELPITGGNSGGNAIGKSSGVVVPIQYQVVLAATKTWGAPGNIVVGQGTIGGGSGGGSIGGESFGNGGPSRANPNSARSRHLFCRPQRRFHRRGLRQHRHHHRLVFHKNHHHRQWHHPVDAAQRPERGRRARPVV